MARAKYSYHNQYTNPWTEQEIRLLKQNYLRMTDVELSEILNRTLKAIESKRLSLGLKKLRRWTKGEISVLIKNKNLTQGKLAELINRRPRMIGAKRRALGIKKKKGLKPFYLTGIDKGILVGLIEGEGTIGLYFQKNSRDVSDNCPKLHGYLSPKVIVGNFDDTILNWVKDRLRQLEVSPDIANHMHVRANRTRERLNLAHLSKRLLYFSES